MRKLELKKVPVKKLVPYEKNPRKNDGAVEHVAKSLQEFGLVKNSVVVDENFTLLAGHTTLKAMVSLGWKTVPEVTQVFDLTESQKKAYRIADNKTGEFAEWNVSLLLKEIEELKAEDYDISITGFDAKEFKDLERGLSQGEAQSLESDLLVGGISPPQNVIHRPEIGNPRYTDDDLSEASRKLEQVTGKPHKMISAFCPKCGHEFEIGG